MMLAKEGRMGLANLRHPDMDVLSVTEILELYYTMAEEVLAPWYIQLATNDHNINVRLNLHGGPMKELPVPPTPQCLTQIVFNGKPTKMTPSPRMGMSPTIQSSRTPRFRMSPKSHPDPPGRSPPARSPGRSAFLSAIKTPTESESNTAAQDFLSLEITTSNDFSSNTPTSSNGSWTAMEKLLNKWENGIEELPNKGTDNLFDRLWAENEEESENAFPWSQEKWEPSSSLWNQNEDDWGKSGVQGDQEWDDSWDNGKVWGNSGVQEDQEWDGSWDNNPLEEMTGGDDIWETSADWKDPDYIPRTEFQEFGNIGESEESAIWDSVNPEENDWDFGVSNKMANEFEEFKRKMKAS